ncbi:MAG: hypothetical protein ABIF11_11400 [Nitrospirota bacterium]
MAIVAVLAGAMIPFITSARQKARAAKFVQLADTLTTACRLHESDTGRYAIERSDAPPNVWPLRELSVARPIGIRFGWDGPYIVKELTNDDVYLTSAFGWSALWVWNTMGPGDFDLDGDGAVDKNQWTSGNSIQAWWFSESEAKAINDVVDINIPGDWKVTGKVIYVPSGAGLGWVGVYMLGGL